VPANPLLLEYQRLQHELAGLLSIYNEKYPDVVIARKRINEIKQLIARGDDKEEVDDSGEFVEIKPEVRNPEIYNSLVAVKSNISRLQQREADLRKQIKVYERRVEEIPANEQRLSDLRRDYDVSLRNYQTLLEKKFNAKLSENLEKRQKGERFTIIDPANLPEKPFKPNRFMVVVVAFFGGTGTGVGLIALLEFLNPLFRNPEDFEGVVQLKVLTTIPEFSKRPSGYSKKG
ncbi:MAG: GNVR domain-containing protein, partial [Thermodesulfobacteriota bacterium]